MEMVVLPVENLMKEMEGKQRNKGSCELKTLEGVNLHLHLQITLYIV